MLSKDIFIQAVGFLGTVLFFLSYQCKQNKNLFRVQFVSYLCYTTHLLMLGAVTGGISYILNTVRSFCLGSRNRFLKSNAMCAIICALQVITLIFTMASYTYGPLLGLFAFGIFTRRSVRSGAIPAIAVASPTICYILSSNSAEWLCGYQFSYELIILNGAITMLGLCVFSKKK